MRILIVEDDSELGNLLKQYLERLGHESVTHVPEGKQALKELQLSSFDCAFVDLQLPDVNGLEILKELKTTDPSIPVIMMSGYPTLERSIEAMRLGASDFLTKPFAFQDLVVSLERALREREILLENISLKLDHQAKLELEKLNKQLEANIEEQKILFQVSNELDEVRSSDALYETLIRWASTLTNAREMGFYAIIPPGNQLVLVAEKNSQQSHISSFPKIINRNNELANLTLKYSSLGKNGLSRTNIPSEALQSPPIHTWLHSEFSSLNHDCNIWCLEIRGEPFGFLVGLIPKENPNFDKSKQRILEFLLKKAGLTLENLALYESLMANFYGILRSLVNALEAKDQYTGKHSERVTHFALKIATYMNCSNEELESLKTVGYLHDIGKIGIPDDVLTKPGRLTAEEFELIKQHPVIGESIVRDLGFSDIERSIIRHHHERWDGKGYPDGIGGEDIPLTTRIISAADAFDAMSTDRSYRKALPMERIVQEFKNNRGTQFDPLVTDAVLDLINERTQEGEASDT